MSKRMREYINMTFDCCWGDRAGDTVSDHSYDYSIGFGDAWSIAVPTTYQQRHSEGDLAYREEYGIKGYRKEPWTVTKWKGASMYNYGYHPARYPVPALRRRVDYRSLWSVLRWIGYLPTHTPRF